MVRSGRPEKATGGGGRISKNGEVERSVRERYAEKKKEDEREEGRGEKEEREEKRINLESEGKMKSKGRRKRWQKRS